jgi:hypothetical protein
VRAYEDISERMLDESMPDSVTHWARDVLAEVADGCLAIRAVRHPLGFICLPVLRAGRHGVCVHQFGAQTHRPLLTTEPVHAHSWDLHSHVLYGSLCNEMVHVLDDQPDPTHRVFEVYSRPDGDEIRRTPRLVRFEIGSTAVNGPGDRYRVRAGEFHLSAPPDHEVATLVLGSGRPDAVDLTLAPIHTPTHLGHRDLLDLAATRRLARDIAEHLALTTSPEAKASWRHR